MRDAPTRHRTNFVILALLLLLTAVTIASAGIDLGNFNIVAALLIASCKASLVLWYFMHLSHASKLLIGTFLTTIGFLAIMIGFLFWDIAFR